jgi:tryptophan 2,3-dioxygenase
MTDENKDNIRLAVDVEGEHIHWDQDTSYGQYLQLDKILNAQKLPSGQHDEMLFLIIHQASELWMKLSLHELHAAIAEIKADNLGLSFKMLARVARIQVQMLQSWDVLSTLTPVDYLKFRDALGKSSGFQSYQYRMMEFAVGNKNKALTEVHRGYPEIYDALQKTLQAPSLYDEVLKLLARRGLDVPDSVTDRDWSVPYEPNEAVEDVWLEIYRDADKYFDLYELAEKLVDFEHRFQQWRFNHLKTVERIIGHKRGTGGSSGVPYLAKALDLRFFPELWSLRTKL